MSPYTLPSTMRAWTYSRRGLPRDVLNLASSHPTPAPPTGSNVMIRVSHVGMGPGSTTVMTTFPFIFGRTSIPELEYSGVIHSVGSSSVPTDLMPGTRIFGTLRLADVVLYCKGAMAEYLSVGSDTVTKIPEGLSFAEAAGLDGAGQTASKMIRRAGITEGMKVLVNGASGGVGTMVVQLVKATGAEVVATCSEGNMEMVRALGADEVVDYRANKPLHEYLAKEYKGKPFDAILDTTGTQALYENSSNYLKAEGPFVNVGGFEGTLTTLFNWWRNVWWPAILPGGTPRRYVMFSTVPNPEIAKELARMASEKKVKVVIESVFDMEDALEAYDKLLSRRAKGKIIIKINDIQ